MSRVHKSNTPPSPPQTERKNPIQMGEMAIELPGSWSDRTVYTFVAPRVVDPRQSPHLRMRSGFRENLSVSRERIPYGTTAEDYLDDQLEELQPRLQRFRFLYDEPILISGQTGHSVAYRFSLRGQRLDVCQLRIAVPVGYDMLVFTGTAAAHVFDQKKDSFVAVAQSLRFPPQPLP
ncbi:MAG: DUF1795 domain-containing protein [Deltaproteobacteria bacterium]|nr:MAG: DUF1795 domain-containing protein [Deltaproteobacteria bacterium]